MKVKFDVTVAHRKYEIGSINDRVIKSIYESDLVVANLTLLNPNVMFELGIRFSFGKPTIVIAEQGTNLPFDVIDQNTIFYINDPTGAAELKEKIIKFEENIDYKKEDYGPVFNVISKVPLYNVIESGKNVSSEQLLQYVINRLDTIEKNINTVTPKKEVTNRRMRKMCRIEFDSLEQYNSFFDQVHNFMKSQNSPIDNELTLPDGEQIVTYWIPHFKEEYIKESLAEFSSDGKINNFVIYNSVVDD